MQIENCVIDRFSEGIGSGEMNASSSFFIKDTIIKNSLSNGVTISTTAGLVRATFDNCQFINNGTSGIGNGINVAQRGRVNARDSVATGNQGASFLVGGGEMITAYMPAAIREIPARRSFQIHSCRITPVTVSDKTAPAFFIRSATTPCGATAPARAARLPSLPEPNFSVSIRRQVRLKPSLPRERSDLFRLT